MANKYSGKSVTFAGICLDDGDFAAIRSFSERFKVPYPILLLQPGVHLPVDVCTIPVTLLVDRHGRVAETFVGMVSTRAMKSDLDQLLRES
jgi:hypothetical protein